ncbi:MAG TPA: hypothetical protein VI363_06010 [Burkholderiales bacterium]
MNEKKPRRLGTIFLIVLACAGAVACAKSPTNQTPQTPTAFAVHRFGTDGTPDATFGQGGVVLTDIDPAVFDFAVAVALTSGNIIAAGQTVVNGQAAIVVVRYLVASGALDTTFGTGGIVRTVVGSGTAGASSVVVQPDGKILVAATTFNGSTTTGFALVRYNSTDGSLDTSFNGNGVVIGPTIGLGSAQDAVSLALQGTNIIVAGADSSGSFVLARFTPAGALDPTFGGGTTGKVTTSLGAAGIGAMPPAIALQADGSIVAAGGVGNFNTTNAPDVALVHYSVDGVLDTNFGTVAGGIVITDIGSSINYANAVAVVQPGDKIVVAGHANVNLNAGTSDIAVLQYNPNGTPDTTFGAGQGLHGFVVTDLGGFENALSVALQASDGKIVVSGNSINTVAVNLVVLRYDTVGNLDTAFGTGGLVVVAPIGPSVVTSGNAVAVQADGKIVTVGYD